MMTALVKLVKGYSTIAWTPFFRKITILWTGPQLLQIVYKTSCEHKTSSKPPSEQVSSQVSGVQII